MTGSMIVCPPDHDHAATTLCRIHHKCRCLACLFAAAHRASYRRAQIAAGTYVRGRVDVAPVREHLDTLRSFGIGARQVAKLTGIADVIIASIIWGIPGHAGLTPKKTITARYATRILAVTPTLDNVADGACIAATGTRRRLQALAWVGWSSAAIARHSGLHVNVVARSLHHDHVTGRTARIIATAYDELWHQTPTAASLIGADMIRRTQTRARGRGWLPPLAWDDIDTDDAPPTSGHDDSEAAVDVIAVELAVTGHQVSLTTRERHEVVRQLNARLYFDAEIATICDVATETIARDRKLLGIPSVTNEQRNPADATRIVVAA